MYEIKSEKQNKTRVILSARFRLKLNFPSAGLVAIKIIVTKTSDRKNIKITSSSIMMFPFSGISVGKGYSKKVSIWYIRDIKNKRVYQ